MKSGNPALQQDPFLGLRRPFERDDIMTMNGCVTKTLVLFCCLLISAGWVWLSFVHGNFTLVNAAVIIGTIGGLIVAVVTIFKPTTAPWTAPLYAFLEGLVLGGISAVFESKYPGIAFQAVTLTLGTLACMLLLYRFGWIEATENFRLGVFAATGGIALFYLVTIVLSFFGISVPMMSGSGPISIGFSVFVVIIAALNLVIDFDFIQQGAQRGAPKYMEWYGAFVLMVTLVWLYLEILRLLSKVRSR